MSAHTPTSDMIEVGCARMKKPAFAARAKNGD
jgi:hypothetical protein